MASFVENVRVVRRGPAQSRSINELARKRDSCENKVAAQDRATQSIRERVFGYKRERKEAYAPGEIVVSIDYMSTERIIARLLYADTRRVPNRGRPQRKIRVVVHGGQP